MITRWATSRDPSKSSIFPGARSYFFWISFDGRLKKTMLEYGFFQALMPAFFMRSRRYSALPKIASACFLNSAVEVDLIFHQNFKGARALREQVMVGTVSSRYPMGFGLRFSNAALVEI